MGSGGPDHAGRLDRPAAHVQLDDGRRYLVNVGSVGQPRDRDPRACYAIWDLEARAVTIRRVLYDHAAAAAKILAAGLPRALADRLAHVEPEPGVAPARRAPRGFSSWPRAGVLGALAFPRAGWSPLAWVWLVPALSRD